MADDPSAGKLREAPGRPGIDATWTSSAKDMVSTSLGTSRIWATFGYGIVNEIYWPSTGQPQIRDLGFIIAGPKGWIEVKRAQRYTVTTPRAFVPLPRVVHDGEGYRLELEYLVHPLRDTLLIRYKLDGDDLKLYALLAPHLNVERMDNRALAGEDLSAERGGVAVCLRCDSGFTRTSAGYVGTSDGWQDFDRNGRMSWTYDTASAGNVALMGEIAENTGVLALSLADTLAGARTLSRSSLADDYDAMHNLFVEQWQKWGSSLDIPYTSPEFKHEAELSAAVIKIHEDRAYAGALVASLSVPWGQSHDDPGGYHLVWTRDAVEAAFAMIAVGQVEDASRTLAYLIGTQAADGSWAQNYFPDGRGYWSGSQLDEVALPVLLMAKLRAVGRLEITRPIKAMVKRAIGFIVRNGPMSDQDRWEENSGASPFTLTVTICALVAAADLFEPATRDYLLSLADSWNERIESWTYAKDGSFCAKYGIPGYYIRLAPRDRDGGLDGAVDVRNVTSGQTAARDLVGLEFLYYVRAGLRAVDDPRIVDTLKVVDDVLRVETPSGPAYHRYNGDGYGEQRDGGPFNGSGIGRAWPLLTGERGHYAVLAGEDATLYLDAMSRMTGIAGLIPEQVWDSEPIPERGLYPGKPSGSAMPLVWAHAEFLKLLAAQTNRRPAELLDAVQSRYGGQAPAAQTWHWRANSPFSRMPAGRDLLIEAASPFTLDVARDGDKAAQRASVPGPLGLHQVRIAATELDGAVRLGLTLTPQDGEAQAIAIELGG